MRCDDLKMNGDEFIKLYRQYIKVLDGDSFLEDRLIDYKEWLKYCKKYETLILQIEEEQKSLMTLDGALESKLNKSISEGIDVLVDVLNFGEPMEKIKAMEVMLKAKMQFVAMKQKPNNTDNAMKQKVEKIVMTNIWGKE